MRKNQKRRQATNHVQGKIHAAGRKLETLPATRQERERARVVSEHAKKTLRELKRAIRDVAGIASLARELERRVRFADVALADLGEALSTRARDQQIGASTRARTPEERAALGDRTAGQV